MRIMARKERKTEYEELTHGESLEAKQSPLRKFVDRLMANTDAMEERIKHLEEKIVIEYGKEKGMVTYINPEYVPLIEDGICKEYHFTPKGISETTGSRAYMETLDNIIGIASWEACDNCIHFDDEKGCMLDRIDLDAKVGDFIVCMDFKEDRK